MAGISPARLFKAFILDVDNLIPKIAPQAIKSAEIIKGEEGENWRWRIYLDEPDNANKSSQIWTNLLWTDIRWTDQKVTWHSINHCVISKKP